MEANVVILIIQTVMLIAGGYFTYTRLKFQNMTDDAAAAKDFRDTILSMQLEIKELKKSKQDVEELLGRSHLQVALEIEMGKAPIVASWKWMRREEDVPVEA